MHRLLHFLLFAPALASAQFHWADANLPARSVGLRGLYNDPQEEQLLAIGLTTTAFNDFTFTVIPACNEGSWTLGSAFSGWTYTAIRYGDTLLVGGGLTEVDGVPVTGVAAYHGGTWHSFGDFNSDYVIRRLKILDDELYAVGSFAVADGTVCNGVAKRQGGRWVNVGELAYLGLNDPHFTDVIKYQGDLYVSGVVRLAPNGETGIIKYDGQTWTAPGGGILGGFAGGRTMAVYQGELYLGGSIDLNAGNAGHMIMRWNGSEWNSVGGHLRDQYNSTAGPARCLALLNYGDKLLAAGGFQYAGGVPAQCFAIWDGSRWCGTGDSFTGGLECEALEVFADTLYMASGRIVNGDTVNRLVKWVEGPIEGTFCSSPVNVAEVALPITPSVYPNPGNGLFTLSAPGLAKTRYRIVDPLGRVVSQGLLGPQGATQLDLEHAAAGLYNVILEPAKGGALGIKLIVTD